MNLYRIAKAKYADDLTGTGGLYGPGRWHKEGVQILYTASSVSLAMLEVLGHWQTTPIGMVLVTLSIPDDASILTINVPDLPTNWRSADGQVRLHQIGTDWLNESKYWLLRVPSVHSPTEFNYLLNPLHPDHAKLTIVSVESHPFDPRLK